MSASIESFFVEKCACFERNELDEIARYFSLPCAIYYGPRIEVLETRSDILKALTSKRDKLLESGYAKSACRVIAQSITPGKHLSLWVELRHLDLAGNPISQGTFRYFCARSDESVLSVQLIEYLDIYNFGEQEDLPAAMAVI